VTSWVALLSPILNSWSMVTDLCL